MGDGELDRLREALTARTMLSPMHDDSGEPIGVFRTEPCDCAEDRKPCTYHEGVEAGVDAVLDLLEPTGVQWCESHDCYARYPSTEPGCVLVTVYRLRTPKETRES